MPFKFDIFNGRLTHSPVSNILNPAGLTPTSSVAFKEPVYMFESSKVKAASAEFSTEFVSHASPSSTQHAGTTSKPLGIIPKDAGCGKIFTLQKKWAAQDGLLVWQKMGFRDVGPYYFTLVGVGVGVAYSVFLILKMSFPKKPE